jgi:hypothetical protein
MVVENQTASPRRRLDPEPRRRTRLGGAIGNARLTSIVGALLIVLLAVEGSTIPFLGSLLSVHIFVGMLLLGPVGLKLGTVGYRFVRYYGGGAEYVRAGPPIAVMRVLVAPLLLISTTTLFATGVLLLASPQRGLILLLHKASFIVWIGAASIHILVYLRRATRHVAADLTSTRVRGTGLRFALVLGSLAAGLLIAVLTYSLATPWLHHEHRTERAQISHSER